MHPLVSFLNLKKRSIVDVDKNVIDEKGYFFQRSKSRYFLSRVKLDELGLGKNYLLLKHDYQFDEVVVLVESVEAG